MVRRVPALAGVRDVYGWSGLYEMTPDHNPVLGEHPERAGADLRQRLQRPRADDVARHGRDRLGDDPAGTQRDVRRLHLCARPLRARRAGARPRDDLMACAIVGPDARQRPPVVTPAVGRQTGSSGRSTTPLRPTSTPATRVTSQRSNRPSGTRRRGCRRCERPDSTACRPQPVRPQADSRARSVNVARLRGPSRPGPVSADAPRAARPARLGSDAMGVRTKPGRWP